ncbi:hypothetical protein TIFTF001_012508 [Ficus carica]|uniref:Uncharacterized protein n=1 Tax=Ficus carica TaxID=3494 RepID=A0AA88D1V7_FICCA|nr:hypothetical protein TIFTF001_012508 [Ficus carica]
MLFSVDFVGLDMSGFRRFFTKLQSSKSFIEGVGGGFGWFPNGYGAVFDGFCSLLPPLRRISLRPAHPTSTLCPGPRSTIHTGPSSVVARERKPRYEYSCSNGGKGGWVWGWGSWGLGFEAELNDDWGNGGRGNEGMSE